MPYKHGTLLNLLVHENRKGDGYELLISAGTFVSRRKKTKHM